MTADAKFLVFTRSDRFPWTFHLEFSSLDSAISRANQVVAENVADRAIVMEVGSVDAMPMFTFRHRAVKRA
jgi:hypothetical protein